MDWLKQSATWFSNNISRPALGALQWLGQNVGGAGLDFLEQIPEVGSLVKAARPASGFVSKLVDYSKEAADEVYAKSQGQSAPMARKASLPTLTDAVKARDAVAPTVQAVKRTRQQAPIMLKQRWRNTRAMYGL